MGRRRSPIDFFGVWYNTQEKSMADKRFAQVDSFLFRKKPSLGRVAVSAFHTDRNGIIPNMYRQCNRHSAHPLSGVSLTAYPFKAMFFPAPNGVGL